MNERQNFFSQALYYITFISPLLLFILCSSGYAKTYTAVPVPLQNTFQLNDISYSYNPGTGILTKSYTFQNISGETKKNPWLVNHFLWSNNISTSGWAIMAYDNGTHVYSNDNQTAIPSDNDGFIDWSSLVVSTIDNSTALFPTLSPVQSIQSSISYPFWVMPITWLDGDNATIQIQFSDILNCNWIQNMVWIVLVDCPGDYDCDDTIDAGDNCLEVYNPEQDDTDSDTYGDACDNCVNVPNTLTQGTCVRTLSGVVLGTGVSCIDNSTCEAGEICQMEQGDYNGNGIGDVCECYADIDNSKSVGLSDLGIMKTEFGTFGCTPLTCLADMDGNGNVGLSDLGIMKVQFGSFGCPSL